jgi:SAM-dependent methyltransferase
VPDAYQIATAELSYFADTFPGLFSSPTALQASKLSELLTIIRPEGKAIADLGGGVSQVNGVFQRLGARVAVLDAFDFDADWIKRADANDFAKTLAMQRSALESVGVTFHDCDLCEHDISDVCRPGSLDVVTSYHCLEHLHHSPKRMLTTAWRGLKPGGLMLLEVPNAVNLMKRMRVLCGYTNYTAYHNYFDVERFSGHVREYTVGDLRAIVRHLGAQDYRIFGRNWHGTLSDAVGTGGAFRAADGLLRCVPGACGSLFALLRKPTAEPYDGRIGG